MFYLWFLVAHVFVGLDCGLHSKRSTRRHTHTGTQTHKQRHAQTYAQTQTHRDAYTETHQEHIRILVSLLLFPHTLSLQVNTLIPRARFHRLSLSARDSRTQYNLTGSYSCPTLFLTISSLVLTVDLHCFWLHPHWFLQLTYSVSDYSLTGSYSCLTLFLTTASLVLTVDLRCFWLHPRWFLQLTYISWS